MAATASDAVEPLPNPTTMPSSTSFAAASAAATFLGSRSAMNFALPDSADD
jgi:hypothetical protein